MIKTLSTHYKTIPWLSPSSGIIPDKYILNIYVWTGLKSNVPTEPLLPLENINPLGRTGDTLVDVSKYLNDSLTFSLITNSETSITSSNSLVWVKTEVIYYINGVAQSPEFEVIDNATKGYGYSLDGFNPNIPANNYLATTIEQKVSNSGVYIFTFLASETLDTEIKLISETVTKTFTKTATTDITELAQFCYVKVSEFDGKYIEIYRDDILMNTLLITEEVKYDPLDIVFLNKEGQLQSITLFKEKIDKLNVTKEEYQSSEVSFAQPVFGFHKYKTYNINGRESFSVNSGFVKEDNNELFTQLLLSKFVWHLKDDNYIPLNLETSDIEYKTRNKDRLINYKIDFKYSFNKINDI